MVGIYKGTKISAGFEMRLPEPKDLIRPGSHLHDPQERYKGSRQYDGKDKPPYLGPSSYGVDDQEEDAHVGKEFEEFGSGGVGVDG